MIKDGLIALQRCLLGQQCRKTYINTSICHTHRHTHTLHTYTMHRQDSPHTPNTQTESTHHPSHLIGAQKFHKPWDDTHVQDSLDPLPTSISEVGQGPAGVTNHTLVRLLEQVGQCRENLETKTKITRYI